MPDVVYGWPLSYFLNLDFLFEFWLFYVNGLEKKRYWKDCTQKLPQKLCQKITSKKCRQIQPDVYKGNHHCTAVHCAALALPAKGSFTNHVYKRRGIGSPKILTCCQRSWGSKCQRRGVGGQKKPKSCQRSLWTPPNYLMSKGGVTSEVIFIFLEYTKVWKQETAPSTSFFFYVTTT